MGNPHRTQVTPLDVSAQLRIASCRGAGVITQTRIRKRGLENEDLKPRTSR